MESVQMTPKLLNVYSVLFGLGAVLFTLLFVLKLLPQMNEIQSELVQSELAQDVQPALYQTKMMSWFWIGLSWIIFIVVNLVIQTRKIKVDGNLVFFMKKHNLGFGPWISEKVINLDELQQIKDESQWKWVMTMRPFPLLFHTMIFQMKNASQQKISALGWDPSVFKQLFKYVQQEFPHVMVNTLLVRDKSEKLLREFKQ